MTASAARSDVHRLRSRHADHRHVGGLTEAEAVSSNDVITEETTTDYDAAGNPIFTTDYGRLPRASVSDTGPLDQHAAMRA